MALWPPRQLSPHLVYAFDHGSIISRQVTATFTNIPAATFTVDGALPARDAARIDAGVKYALDPTRSLFANLSGEWSNVGQSISATAGFKLVR